MSFAYSPKITTDGLVFYVDAANPKSYVSGSTTIDNLITDVTGSLINNTDFSTENNGTWTFDGSDDYIIFNAGSTLMPFNNEMTVMGWFKSISSDTKQTIFTVRPAGGSVRWELVKNSTNNLSFRIRDLAASPFYKEIISNTDLELNGWYHGCATWDGSNLKLYLNGISDASPISCSSFYYFVATDYTTIGAGYVSSLSLVNDFNGNIPSTQYYNRALSATEILQNYNATKTRFGL